MAVSDVIIGHTIRSDNQPVDNLHRAVYGHHQRPAAELFAVHLHKEVEYQDDPEGKGDCLETFCP